MWSCRAQHDWRANTWCSPTLVAQSALPRPFLCATWSCTVFNCRFDAGQGCTSPIVSNPALTVMKLFGMMLKEICVFFHNVHRYITYLLSLTVTEISLIEQETIFDTYLLAGCLDLQILVNCLRSWQRPSFGAVTCRQGFKCSKGYSVWTAVILWVDGEMLHMFELRDRSLNGYLSIRGFALCLAISSILVRLFTGLVFN